jgi:TIGR03009 family protein
MTRLPACLLFVLGIAIGSSLAGQSFTNPSANSRYAPAPAAAGTAAQAASGTTSQPPPRTAGPLAAIPRAQQPQAHGQPVATGGAANLVGPPVQPVAPQEPAWVAQLTPEQQEWVHRVLGYWEQRSNKIKMFECKFDRFEYEPVYGPKQHAWTISQGEIKYAQPDKGLYRVEKLFSYAGPPKNPGEQAEYVEQDATFGEHWVCDGQQVFQFDARNKRMIVRPLPPEMRGKAIADGPLPFLFGARAETIQARYWVRNLPQTGNGKYWLEAVPKSRQDAQNFKMVHIVLDEKDYLPEMIQVFAPNYDPDRTPARTTYIFKDRQENDASLLKRIGAGLDPLKIFHQEFHAPKLPTGWQRVVQND